MFSIQHHILFFYSEEKILSKITKKLHCTYLKIIIINTMITTYYEEMRKFKFPILKYKVDLLLYTSIIIYSDTNNSIIYTYNY